VILLVEGRFWREKSNVAGFAVSLPSLVVPTRQGLLTAGMSAGTPWRFLAPVGRSWCLFARLARFRPMALLVRRQSRRIGAMTEHDAPGTEAAPTAAAELADQTTELPPADHAAATPEAWSLDDTGEVEPPSRTSRLVWSGLVALVVVIAGALIFLGTTYFGSRDPKPVVPSAQPTSSTVPVAAPPPAPSTVTVTAGPPAAVPAPTPPAVEPTPVELTDADRQFISKLRNGGIEYPFSNPGYPIGKAHAVCDYEAAHQQVAPGVDKSAQGGKWVEENTIWYSDNAVAFSSLAQATYCPQYLDGEY
jgi:hypothetical protein